MGINCLTQREFRVVIHPSVHLSLGVCSSVLRGQFLFSEGPKAVMPSYMSLMLPKSVASCIFSSQESLVQCLAVL